MCGQGIVSDIMKDQVLHQGKPPRAAFLHFYRDNPTRAPRVFMIWLSDPPFQYAVNMMENYLNVQYIA
jgi:hypothetical protein